jgi:hypothetical protein
MASARDRALAHLVRYSLGEIETLSYGQNRKTTESAVARLVRQRLVASYPFVGSRRLYTLTPKAARLHALDPKRFLAPPGPQAIHDRLTIAYFCHATGNQLLTPAEFRAAFPRHAACRGLDHTRYFIDSSGAQPLLTVIVPDFLSAAGTVARKGRRAVAKRKAHPPFRAMIYHHLLQVAFVSMFPTKLDALRAELSRDTFPKTFTAIPELATLLLHEVMQ